MKIEESDEVRFWIENGILYSQFKKPSFSDLEFAKRIIELRHKISDGKKQYWCYDLFNLKEFTKDSRDYAEMHGQDMLHATAAVVYSHATKFFVNIFVKIKKPHVPFKAFNDKESALKWLMDLKSENEAKGIF